MEGNLKEREREKKKEKWKAKLKKSKIKEIDRNRIVYDDDLYIPIGDSYKQAFLDFLGQ